MKKRTKTNEKPIHPTNSQVQSIERDIRSLRDSGKSDSEIRALLGLELRTYQKYNKRINEIDKAIFYSLVRDEIESQLLRLKQSLENTYITALQISQDKEYDDRLTALEVKDSARLSICQLLVEGPKYIAKIQSQTQTQPDEISEQESTIKPTTFKRVHS